MLLKDLPPKLKPYAYHGVDFSYSQGDTEVEATCFYCGKEEHLYINTSKGVHNCKSCDGSGNVYKFLGQILDDSLSGTRAKDYQKLSEERSVHHIVLPFQRIKLYPIFVCG